LRSEDVIAVRHVHDHVDDVTAPAMRVHPDARDDVDRAEAVLARTCRDRLARESRGILDRNS
jgi:hypothetical protein